jgi:hypothetical protein
MPSNFGQANDPEVMPSIFESMFVARNSGNWDPHGAKSFRGGGCAPALPAWLLTVSHVERGILDPGTATIPMPFEKRSIASSRLHWLGVCDAQQTWTPKPDSTSGISFDHPKFEQACKSHPERTQVTVHRVTHHRDRRTRSHGGPFSLRREI